jgi:hypothetical protein
MISSIVFALILSLVNADGGGKDIYNGIFCCLIMKESKVHRDGALRRV